MMGTQSMAMVAIAPVVSRMDGRAAANHQSAIRLVETELQLVGKNAMTGTSFLGMGATARVV